MTEVTKKIWQELFNAFYLIIKGAKTFPKKGKIRILNFISHKMPAGINVTNDFLSHCNFPEMISSEESQIREQAIDYCEKILQFNPEVTMTTLFG